MRKGCLGFNLCFGVQGFGLGGRGGSQKRGILKTPTNYGDCQEMTAVCKGYLLRGLHSLNSGCFLQYKSSSLRLKVFEQRVSSQRGDP